MLSNKEIQNLVLLELMAPSPEESDGHMLVSYEEGNAIRKRFKATEDPRDWGFVLNPIKDINTKSRMITLMQMLDHDDIR